MLKKRLAKSLVTVAAISSLVAGGSFALFTASTGNQGNTFTAGTVTLGSPVSVQVPLNPLAPGDSGTADVSVNYTGNLDAWVGFDATLTGDLAHELTVTAAGTTVTTAGIQNQVIGTAAVSTGATVIVPVDYELDLDADNADQGKSATLNITIKAVQADHNNNTGNTGPSSWSN